MSERAHRRKGAEKINFLSITSVLLFPFPRDRQLPVSWAFTSCLMYMLPYACMYHPNANGTTSFTVVVSFFKGMFKSISGNVESRYFYFLVHDLSTYVSLRQLIFANPLE